MGPARFRFGWFDFFDLASIYSLLKRRFRDPSAWFSLPLGSEADICFFSILQSWAAPCLPCCTSLFPVACTLHGFRSSSFLLIFLYILHGTTHNGEQLLPSDYFALLPILCRFSVAPRSSSVIPASLSCRSNIAFPWLQCPSSVATVSVPCRSSVAGGEIGFKIRYASTKPPRKWSPMRQTMAPFSASISDPHGWENGAVFRVIFRPWFWGQFPFFLKQTLQWGRKTSQKWGRKSTPIIGTFSVPMVRTTSENNLHSKRSQTANSRGCK